LDCRRAAGETMIDQYMQEAERETNEWSFGGSMLTILMIVFLLAMCILPVVLLFDATIMPQISGTLATLEAIKP
jgi:hypothetical protein